MRVKMIVKLGLLLAAGIFTGTILLCLVYSLPVSPMQEHMRESLDEFVQEGDNPFMMDGYKGSSLDNTTDATMLGNAVYESSLPVYKAAMLAERGNDEGAESQEALKNYLDGKKMDQISTYARYWHGYLVILKPLLLILNFQEIRLLNGIVMAILTLLTLGRMSMRNMRSGMVAFVLAVASLFPVALPLSLQFSSVYYIGVTACLIILWKYDWIENMGKWLYFFLIVGMLTSYLDFLTYPLFTFGMPLIIYIAIRKPGLKDGIFKIIQTGICWSVGYIGMWAGKWLIGSVLTRNNLFLDAVGAVENRMSSTVYEEKVNRIFAVLRNLYIYRNLYGVVLAGLLLIWLVVYIWRSGRNNIEISGVILLLCIACMPAVWYMCTVNHSFSHYWFTFRSLAVSVFAVGMIPEACKRGVS